MMNKNVVVSNIFSWYLSDSDMSYILPGAVNGSGQECFHYLYTGASSLDLINFSGNISLECFKYGTDWIRTLRHVKLKTASVLVIAVGGAILYYLRRPRPPGSSGGHRGLSSWRWPGQTLWEWLFAEELVEDPSLFYDSYDLHSYYFGPNNIIYQEYIDQFSNSHEDAANDAEDEADSEDFSLNSLSNKSSPVKFLKKPIFDISYDGKSARFRNLFTPKVNDRESPSPVQTYNPCPNCVKGNCRLKRHQISTASSTTSSCYSGSPIFRNRIKTSTPEQAEEDQILQRTVAYNRLTFRHFVPGHDIRMRGDGCDTDISLGLSRDTSLSSLAEASGCSMSSSMIDLVKDARQVRRLIREVSLDSQDSDLDVDLELKETSGLDLDHFYDEMNKLIENCDDNYDLNEEVQNAELSSNVSQVSGPCLSRESSIPDFNLIQRKTGINRKLWKLTGFSEYESLNFSESSDHENVSMEWDSPVHMWNRSLSRQDTLEWDNEFTGDNVTLDDELLNADVHTRGWLRNIDSSQFSSRNTSRRSSTDTDTSRVDVRYMTRYPPSGRSSVDRESVFSKLSEDDFPTDVSRNRSHHGIKRSSSGSFRSGSVSPSSCSAQAADNNNMSGNRQSIIMNTSATSLESGFQDGESSMTSSVCSLSTSMSSCPSAANNSWTSYPPAGNNSNNTSLLVSYPLTPLSPVKECKEPRSPAKLSQQLSEDYYE